MRGCSVLEEFAIKSKEM